LGANWRKSTETFQFFGALFELDPTVFFRHAQSTDADLLGALQDAQRQPFLRHHRPFLLPILLDVRQHHIVDEVVAALPHHLLFFGQTPVVHVHNP
jgi:hypothetical protein